MTEITSVVWVCTKCGKVFTGPFEGEPGVLPCGHTFGFAAAPTEVARCMRIAEVVLAEDFENRDYADLAFRLEALVNE